MHRLEARRRTVCALAPAGATLSAPGRARAQEDHAASRTLRETTFMLPAMSDSAFVLTEFGFRQAINYESIGNFPVASFARYNLSWIQFEERADLAFRITPWLGLYAQGTAAGALGPDTASLLFEGGGLTFGGKGGAVIRLVRSEHTGSQIALRVYAGGDAGRTLDLPDFVYAFAVRTARDVVGIVQNTSSLSQIPGSLQNEALSLSNADYSAVIFYRSSTWKVGASLHYAQALVGPLTLQLSANVEQTWSKQKPFNPAIQDFVTLTTKDTTVTFDGTLSAAFNRWSVPIGLSAEYAGVTTARSLNGVKAYGLTTQYVGGGLWFTGRRGVEIGVLLFTQRSLKPVVGFGTSQTSDKPVGYLGSLVFRALW